jgi:hypothetical protein
MDCCSHEGPAKGNAKFDFKKIADGVHVAVAAPAYKVNCNTAIIESDDGVVIVDTHSKPSAARLIVEGLGDITKKPVIMGHGEPAGRDWLRTFRGYVHDMVEAVREEAARGATLEEVQRRVPDRLAPTYEKPFSTYGDYRPWRAGLLRNIERTYAMVS